MSRRSQVLVSLLFALLVVWLAPDRRAPAPAPAPAEPVARPIAAAPMDAPGVPGAVAPEDRWDDDTLPRPLRAIERRLSNGIAVWIVEDPTEPQIAARVAIGAGGVDDPPDQLGLAHLVEHLIFQGTDRLGALAWQSERAYLDRVRELSADPAVDPEVLGELHTAASAYAAPNELMRVLDRLGATDVNASTAPEVTSFQATIPPRALGQWAALMAEALARPVFRGFVPERAVVEHEASLREGCGLRRGRHELFAAMYGDHPYGRPVGGTAETRAAIDVDAAAAFHARLYRPDNALVVLVGDVVADDAVAELERELGGWRSAPTARPRWADPPSDALPAATVEGKLWYAWPVDEDTPPEVVRVLAAAIDRELEEAEGLTKESAFVTRRARGSALLVSATCKREFARETCEQALLASVRRGRQVAPEIVRGVARSAWVQELRRMESVSAQADEFVEVWGRGEPSESAWGWRSRIRALRADAFAGLPWLTFDGFVEAEVVREAEADAMEPPPTVSDAQMSAFAKALLARPTALDRPGWREAGRHWRWSADGSVAASPNPRNTLFRAELVWPMGWTARKPGPCEALSEWVAAEREVFAPQGVMLSREACAWDRTSLVLTGPEEYAAWAVRRALADLRATDRLESTSASGSASNDRDMLFRIVPEADWDGQPRRLSFVDIARDLGEIRPRVAYSGRYDPGEVAAWLPAGAAPALAAWPERVSLGFYPIGSAASPSEAYIRAIRVGQPYDPDDEALYALYERWLTGGGGALFEEVRTKGAGAYGFVARFRRGRWPGDPNLTFVEVRTEGDWIRVAHDVGAVLSTERLEPGRWEGLVDATRAHLWSDVVPFRSVPLAAMDWRDRGFADDPRRAAWVGLTDVTPEAFDAFLAEEAAQPIAWDLFGRGADATDWSSLPR